MDFEVAVFLLIFLSLGVLATVGICFVEIRSCWRNYRLEKSQQDVYFLSDECTCNLAMTVQPKMPTTTMPMTIPTPAPMPTLVVSKVDSNHKADVNVNIIDDDSDSDDDAPPQDFLDALVLGDAKQRLNKTALDGGLDAGGGNKRQQIVFANMANRKNGDLV